MIIQKQPVCPTGAFNRTFNFVANSLIGIS